MTMIFEKVDLEFQLVNTSLLRQGMSMLPVNFDNLVEGLNNLKAISKSLSHQSSLEEIIRNSIEKETGSSRYALVLMGNSPSELMAEIERAQDGLPAAMESGRDWQTPIGSFFTPRPARSERKNCISLSGRIWDVCRHGQGDL